jgi:Flp pilus assembly protein TadD
MLRDNAGNLVARAFLVRGLLAKGNVAEADTELNQLVQAAPNDPTVLSLRGNVLTRQGNFDAAAKEFDRALTLQPRSTEALAGAVTLDMRARHVDAAKARVEKRLAIDQRPDPELLLLAGRVYAATGDNDKSEQALKALVAAAPTADAHAALGDLYVRERRFDLARAEYEQVVAKNPSSVAANTVLAIILEAQNKPDEAQNRYRAVLTLDPRAPVAANNLAWLYATRGGDLDEALRLAQSAQRERPDDPQINDTLGWTYYKKNLPLLAIPPLQKSVAGDPRSPRAQYHLGVAYADAGQPDNARVSLQQALKLSANFEEAADARARLATLATH